MEHLTSSEERRRFSRIAFEGPAELEIGGERIACDVLDVSLRGALVRIARRAAAERSWPCALVIRLGAGEAEIRMDGDIVRRDGTLLAVRCDEIDLESITHLRRLVELNLGDEELLHRELGALVRPRHESGLVK